MSTRVCPVCGSDYLDWAQVCTTCGVSLVPASEAPDPLRLPVEEQVVYELGVWPLGLQAAAAQAMAESGIPHGWAGTDLVVQLDHEATVDALMDEIEAAQPGIVGADHLDGDDGWPAQAAGASDDDESDDDESDDADADENEIDDDIEDGAGDDPGVAVDELLEYELDEWPEADRAELSARLGEGGIPFRWEDETLLVVSARDEQLVEAMLDELEFPDALPAAGDDGESGEDEASFELMSDLFLAADRLKNNTKDPDGIADLARVVEQADPDRPPFGVEPALWSKAVLDANDLADRLAGGGDADGDGFADEVLDPDGEPVFVMDDVRARAGALRDLLRPFV